MAKYKRTFSAGEKKLSVANEVIDFYNTEVRHPTNISVQFLQFQTFGSPCRIKLNKEETIHWIDVDSEFIISDINIDKFTILDDNVEYYYTAMTIE